MKPPSCSHASDLLAHLALEGYATRPAGSLPPTSRPSRTRAMPSTGPHSASLSSASPRSAGSNRRFSADEVVRTKIVATIGPASRSEEAIHGLVEAGVDVFRLNMAHGSMEEHQQSVDRIRAVSAALQRPVAVLVDLAGPKIRLGELPDGMVECVEAATITFVRGDEGGSADRFVTNYPPLIDELAVGDSVMIADGTVSLIVESKDSNEARCRVVQAGPVRSRQGVNLPGVKLSVPAMSQADWQHAEWAAASGADFVSLSFVRSSVEVTLCLAGAKSDCNGSMQGRFCPANLGHASWKVFFRKRLCTWQQQLLQCPLRRAWVLGQF